MDWGTKRSTKAAAGEDADPGGARARGANGSLELDQCGSGPGPGPAEKWHTKLGWKTHGLLAGGAGDLADMKLGGLRK